MAVLRFVPRARGLSAKRHRRPMVSDALNRWPAVSPPATRKCPTAANPKSGNAAATVHSQGRRQTGTASPWSSGREIVCVSRKDAIRRLFGGVAISRITRSGISTKDIARGAAIVIHYVMRCTAVVSRPGGLRAGGKQAEPDLPYLRLRRPESAETPPDIPVVTRYFRDRAVDRDLASGNALQMRS